MQKNNGSKNSTLTKPLSNIERELINGEMSGEALSPTLPGYDPQAVIENQFADIYNNMGSTITKQNLLDQLEKKKQNMASHLASQRRPIASTSKRQCADMKMVQIAFGENLANEESGDHLVGNEAPPKFLGNGKFGQMQGLGLNFQYDNNNTAD